RYLWPRLQVFQPLLLAAATAISAVPCERCNVRRARLSDRREASRACPSPPRPCALSPRRPASRLQDARLPRRLWLRLRGAPLLPSPPCARRPSPRGRRRSSRVQLAAPPHLPCSS